MSAETQKYADHVVNIDGYEFHLPAGEFSWAAEVAEAMNAAMGAEIFGAVEAKDSPVGQMMLTYNEEHLREWVRHHKILFRRFPPISLEHVGLLELALTLQEAFGPERYRRIIDEAFGGLLNEQEVADGIE